MSRTHTLLAAPAVAATMLLGTFTGAAIAQETGPGSPECAEAQEQLVDLQGQLQAAIAADNDTGAPEDSQAVIDLKAQVQAAVGTVDEQCAPPADDQGGDTQTPEPTNTPAPDPTGEPPAEDPPADTDQPRFETCAEAAAAGVILPATIGRDPGYQLNLDRDQDGVACEANEGPPGSGSDGIVGTPDVVNPDTDDQLGGDGETDSGVVDSIPNGSVDTGYVA